MQGRIVFATGNAGKIKEIRMIMEDTGMVGIHERCGDYGRY